MAAFTHGMNVDEVRQLGALLERAAHQIEQIIQDIENRIHQTTWAGPDSNQFKNNSWPQHRGHLKSASSELTQFGGTAKKQAEEQVSASSH